MEKMISPKTKDLWLDIFKKYREILKKGGGNQANVSEDIVGIQAKRLVKAERSALKYGTK